VKKAKRRVFTALLIIRTAPDAFMATTPNPPVYLVELLDPHLVSHDRVDITRFLENAIETVFKHLADFAEPVEAQVTIDAGSRELAGILFFNEEGEAISVIRPYYLDRESVECESEEICRIAAEPLAKLEKNLNRIFKR
jgi:hypothetical protein